MSIHVIVEERTSFRLSSSFHLPVRRLTEAGGRGKRRCKCKLLPVACSFSLSLFAVKADFPSLLSLCQSIAPLLLLTCCTGRLKYLFPQSSHLKSPSNRERMMTEKEGTLSFVKNTLVKHDNYKNLQLSNQPTIHPTTSLDAFSESSLYPCMPL